MMELINNRLRRLPTWPVWLALTLPAGFLIWGAALGRLGPDPVRALEAELGEWGLRFLLASLAITPLARLGIRAIRFRRALGVMGLAYIGLHFTTWVVLDMGLLWSQILSDLYKRPYILVGATGLLLLIPLGITSTNGWIRRLGPRWRQLHRLSYPAILCGAVHFVMIGKVWMTEPLIYLAIAVGLVALRLPGIARKAAPSLH
jgi:sulfoxide reductase heme-binding subunit YedZ